MSIQAQPLGTFAEPAPQVMTPTVRRDERGYFLEQAKDSTYLPHGIGPFVQTNHSRSHQGVLRGLHWQVDPYAQGKLVSVARGRIFDVAVDLRRSSPTFGAWAAAVLGDDTHEQLWVPPGFAHGFLVLSDVADVIYANTHEYVAEAERNVRWDDPDLAIAWGISKPSVSERDAAAPLLRNVAQSDLGP